MPSDAPILVTSQAKLGHSPGFSCSVVNFRLGLSAGDVKILLLILRQISDHVTAHKGGTFSKKQSSPSIIF
jgi:hypothetical protein